MQTLRKSSDFVTRKIAGKTLLLQINRSPGEKQGYLLELNETADFLWSRLDDGLSESDLVARLSEEFANEFGIENEQALEDVRDFITEMKGMQAIQ